jgi:putative flippase GtrA
VVRRLPFGLASVVAPSLIGFALINGLTFGVDLGLLTVFHGWLGLPLWLSITLGYLGAFGLSFVLNRALNFRSHAPVGAQTVRYAVVIAVNYFALLLGIGGGLVALGVEYHLSRLAAGAGEAVFMYCALRWVVFPRKAESLDQREVEGAGQPDLTHRRLAGVEGPNRAVGLPPGPPEEGE